MLKIGVQNLFNTIGCNNEHSKEIVGAHGVTDSNIVGYLGIIEQRTNEILQMYTACQSKGLEAQQALQQPKEPVNMVEERLKEQTEIDFNVLEDTKKVTSVIKQIEEDNIDDEGRVVIAERGEDTEVKIVDVLELKKKAQEFASKNFKLKPKANKKSGK